MVSVQEGSLSKGGLCPGGSLSGEGSLSRRGLCPRGSLGRGLCPGGWLLGRPPYGNERTVRILLECILVFCLRKGGSHY